MVKNHIKRIAIPSTWTTAQKKGVTWAPRTRPGSHSLEEGMPLLLVIRELLKYANTTREVKQILNNKTVLIDGVRRKDPRFTIGFMDIISFPEIKENYRISFNENGKLTLVKIAENEATSKICKINGKGLYKGKMQLRCSDGRTLIVEKGNYKTTDSVVISIPDQKIIAHLVFENGAAVLLIAGKRIGALGTIEEIKDETVTIKSKGEMFETLKRYCFVVGKNKPVLKIE